MVKEAKPKCTTLANNQAGGGQKWEKGGNVRSGGSWENVGVYLGCSEREYQEMIERGKRTLWSGR